MWLRLIWRSWGLSINSACGLCNLRLWRGWNSLSLSRCHLLLFLCEFVNWNWRQGAPSWHKGVLLIHTVSLILLIVISLLNRLVDDERGVLSYWILLKIYLISPIVVLCYELVSMARSVATWPCVWINCPASDTRRFLLSWGSPWWELVGSFLQLSPLTSLRLQGLPKRWADWAFRIIHI